MSKIDKDAILKIYEEKIAKKRVSKSKKVHANEVEDWKSLKKGDVVRSIRGHGPHFVNFYGQKVFKGEYGYYKIDSFEQNGINAYMYSPRGDVLYNGGRRFIYMGEKVKVDVIHREPHKLIKIDMAS
jgi:hypothetical protein